MGASNVLSYYRDHQLNPVPITLDDEASWSSHFAKRRNLYEGHLGIPLALFRGRSVLEFGCNSGENALVLASMGANLTLVEPNEQVLPRLRALFQRFGLEDRIVQLEVEEIDSFESKASYDVVLAEGFLGTLPNRDQLVQKIADFLVPGGIGVISFDDRYGSFLETVRRVAFRRACELNGVDDLLSQESLELARRLYGRGFSNINASRPFKAWWYDGLANPFAAWTFKWSYPELAPLIQGADCDFYSTSPRWAWTNHFMWYKNVVDRQECNARLLDDWARTLPYFLTGMSHMDRGSTVVGREVPAPEVLDAVAMLGERSSEYIDGGGGEIEAVVYPELLRGYLSALGDHEVGRLNQELGSLFDVMVTGDVDELISAYTGGQYLGKTWGTPSQYLCFTRGLTPEVAQPD